MKLGMRICTARRYSRLSQSELAQLVGVTRWAVANWESADDGNPSTSRLEAIAIATNVSYEWLATGRGSMMYQLNLDDTPAVDADIVDDPTERRLLEAFRNAPARIKLLIMELTESHSPRNRRRIRHITVESIIKLQDVKQR